MTHCSIPSAQSAQLLFLGVLAWLSAGCSATISPGSSPQTVYAEEHHNEKREPLGIPRGHLPPPGGCRVWFPGRPPGHQPPPVGCREAMATAPAGTWVLYRADREEVHARVTDPRRRGVVVRVRVYEVNGGRYIRTERS